MTKSGDGRKVLGIDGGTCRSVKAPVGECHRSAKECRGTGILVVAVAKFGVDALLAKTGESGRFECPGEGAFRAQAEEQWTDLGLDTGIDDREQIGPAAAVAASPDGHRHPSAGAQHAT